MSWRGSGQGSKIIKMKKILFLFNGGTIGQILKKVHGQEALVPPKNGNDFKKACAPILKKFSPLHIDFEVITIKDSTNMNPDDWQKLIYRIIAAQDEGYDAVGVAHGTDTMSYTACALAFALHGSTPGKSGLKIPVCLTGAQNSIFHTGGDARFNLENLFRVLIRAIDLGVADILVNFWHKILLGCRCLKVSEKKFDAFASPALEDVGYIDGSGIVIETKFLKLRKNASSKLNPAANFSGGVVGFELAPGIDPKTILGFLESKKIDAMIFKSLGEGNVPCDGKFSLLPVIKTALKKFQIPTFVTTKFIGGYARSSSYETGVKAIASGAIPCFDHTDIAVDVKVKWLLGNKICQTIADFKEAMKTSFAGEVSVL